MKITSLYFPFAGPLILLLLPFTSTSLAAERLSTNLKTDQGSQKMVNSPDIAFLLRAVQSGAGEVQLGKLAMEKAANPAVKELGNEMVGQHGKIDDQLNALAAQRHMTLPATMNARDQAVYQKLQHESTASFDKTYLKAMVKSHKAGIKMFKKEAKKGRDEQIQSLASATLPMLRDHLTHFQRLQARTKTSKLDRTR